jgi:predicted nuclease of predicted toxin-antitoxin system
LKFSADENVPLKAVKALREENFDITSITEIKPGITDEEVSKIALLENRILITFDKDFGKILFVEGLSVSGLVLLRFPPKNVEYITRVLKNVLSKEIKFYGRLVIVFEDKLRISFLPEREGIEK